MWTLVQQSVVELFDKLAVCWLLDGGRRLGDHIEALVNKVKSYRCITKMIDSTILFGEGPTQVIAFCSADNYL